MKPSSNDIGRRIRDMRKAKKMTQQELADVLQITVQSVSQWETGRTQPDTDRGVELANVLGVPWSWLVAGEEIVENRIAEFKATQTDLEKRYAPLTSRQLATRIIGSLAAKLPEIIDDYTIICRYPAVGTMFSIEIEDNDLSPTFRYGDILVFDSGVTIRPGDFVLARPWIEDWPVIRQIRSIGLDDKDRKVVVLRSLNDADPMVTIDLDDDLDRIFAVMVEHRRYRSH